MKWYIRTICFIGGADLNILKKCPNDRNKFIAIGIGVLNTALLSMLTMGYAIYSVINEENLSLITILAILIFSIFWGFIIFGIDWGLISTIHKKRKYDLKSGTFLVLTAIFRLLVAAVISFTVSKPIEVLVFKEYLPVARREMQKDYQDKLNADEVGKEDNATQNLLDAENELIQWSKDKDAKYEKDPIVKKLIEEKNSQISNYENLNARYKSLNSKSSQRQTSAQSSINSISRQISDIKNGRELVSDLEQQQINNLRNSMSSYISTRNYERNQINLRNRELGALNSKIKSKQKEIDSRIEEIDEENKKITDQIIEKKNRLNIEKDSISNNANIVYNKNKEVSDVFEHNNLINNIIAIGYLEKWKNDPNANLGEKEIAKKVIFVRWLLMILILIIDIAPIVIKLLIKRGSYEDEKEKIEENNKLKSQADIIAFSKYYPDKAMQIAEYKAKIEELDAIKNANVSLYKIIDKLRIDSFKQIRKITNGFKSKGKTVTGLQDKMETQLKESISKIQSLFKNFIDNINP